MRIAVISDIHGNGYALQKVLGDAKQRAIDQYYFLGDYITDGPNVNSIINTIRELGCAVLAGNREEYMVNYQEDSEDRWKNTLQYQGLHYTFHRIKKDNMDYLASLPIVLQKQVEDISILLYHGTPEKARQVFIPMKESDRARKMIDKYGTKVFFGGHTHVAYSYELNGHYFFNPGSAGVPIRSSGLNYGILEVSHSNIYWEQITIPYDRNEMIQQLIKDKEFYLKKVGFWSELYFDSIKHNRDIVFDFLSLAYGLADVKTVIGETKDIDNETFLEAIKIWKQNKTQ